MMIEVECHFNLDGRVTIRRLRLDGRWTPVEQGRQWRDDRGRHVLVLLHGRAHTLTLDPNTLAWTLAPAGSGPAAA